MAELDFGHGFLPRVGQVNYRALSRALGPRTLFDPEPLRLPWAILDGPWIATNRDLLGQLQASNTQYLVDPSAWRFQLR